MFNIKIVLLLYVINSVLFTDAKSTQDNVCKTNLVDMTSEPIDDLEEYCKDLNKPCVSKCCGLNEVLHKKKGKDKSQSKRPVCTRSSKFGIDVSNYAKLSIYSTEGQGVSKTTKNFLDDFSLVQNKMFDNKTFENKTCVDLVNPKQNEPYILENGMLAILKTKLDQWLKKGPEFYCVDLIYLENQNVTTFVFFVSRETNNKISKKNIFNGIASIISSIFLVLGLLVYCMLPQLRNLIGLVFMAYMAMLLFTFVFKVIITFFSSSMTCETLMVTFHLFYFVFLSTFFWLNILSFDIWRTFVYKGMYNPASRLYKEVKTFGWYSVYGLGVPLALTIVVLFIDMHRDKTSASTNKPSCLSKSTIYYMYVPTGILVLINYVFFLMSIFKICKIRNNMDAEEKRRNISNTRSYHIVYLKLSVMMGTSWLLELLSVLYGDMPFWAYVLLNIYNGLIGVIIFILFILNKKIFRLLGARFNIRCRCIEDEVLIPNFSRLEDPEDPDVEMNAEGTARSPALIDRNSSSGSSDPDSGSRTQSLTVAQQSSSIRQYQFSPPVFLLPSAISVLESSITFVTWSLNLTPRILRSLARWNTPNVVV